MKKIFTIIFTVAFFAAQMAAQALPVTITYFTAVSEKSGTVKLEWATDSELNASHFDVERSTDAVHFLRIATVKCENRAATYTVTDDTPLSIGAYYRLKQVDLDGQFEIFKNVFVEQTGGKLQVYPNPVPHRSVTISSAKEVEIYDSVGRKVGGVKSGSRTFTDLRQGVYFVRSGTEVKTLVVQ